MKQDRPQFSCRSRGERSPPPARYEIFALDGALRRPGIGEIMTLGAMYHLPVFSPDERLVACSPGTSGAFWTTGDVLLPTPRPGVQR